MSFQLRPDESVRQGIRRIARKQIDKAREALARRGESPEEAVHDARKCFKRLRAVVRLVRDEVGEREYRRANVHFRDAGRPLAEIRDAHALLEALEALAERSPDVPASAWDALRGGLRRRESRVSREVLAEGGAVDAVLAVLDDAQRRVKKWHVGRSFSALESGLKWSYQRGRSACATASADPTAENMHEWRKRVKDLWHHLQIVQSIRPEVLEDLAEQAHRLADLLGDEHDLAVLRAMMEAGTVSAGEGTPDVLASIDRHRGELQQEAVALGDELYRDSPDDFVELLEAYWHLWRWGNEAARLEAARSGAA